MCTSFYLSSQFLYELVFFLQLNLSPSNAKRFDGRVTSSAPKFSTHFLFSLSHSERLSDLLFFLKCVEQICLPGHLVFACFNSSRKNSGNVLKALAIEDTLLLTHCCRHKCFPACSRTTFVTDTNF